MKKLVCLSLIFLSMFTFAGCKAPHYYNYDEMKENIEKVEIINILYDFENAELLKTFDEEEMDEFLFEFSKIEFRYYIGDPYELKGLAIVLYYKNQDYEIICRGNTQKYDNNGKWITGYYRDCSKEVFNNLISIFIDM